MKRLIIFLLLTLSILEVSEGIFRKKKSSNGDQPPGDNAKHKGTKCKWGKKGRHTTTESPNWQYPCYPDDPPQPHSPSSMSREIDDWFAPVLNHPDPDPPSPNCGLPYFPVSEECTCPSSHGKTKKPKNRRRFFSCFGGGGSSEEGGGGHCPKHKTKSKSKDSKHKKGKDKKGKNKKGNGNQGGNGYGGENDVYYDF